MKYLFLLFIAAGIYSCTGNDQAVAGMGTQDSVNRAAMADTANYTSIQWIDSMHLDLGKIPMGQIVEVAWHFKNTGNKPLVIESVRPGCGCTIADKPQEPVAPGKEGVIKAKFNSQGQHVGENQKSVTVSANTRGQTVHNLGFRVEITEK